MPLHIDITIEDPRWTDISEELIKETLLLTSQQFEEENLELSLVLTNDTAIQKLNHDYREKDKPTNVLSFPNDPPLLGDIVMAYETIEHEAIEQGKEQEHHIRHMLVHGLLHLYGYDHITDEDADEMESLEAEILAKMGIKNPYTSTGSM